MGNGLTPEFPKRLIVALGGNAIHPEGSSGHPEQLKAVAMDAARALRPLLAADNELVITHGNGPGVGMIMMRHTLAREHVEPMPLDICVAHSQGGISYNLSRSLENALREVNSDRKVVSLVTQVEVDPADPGFQNPTKPVGLFYDEQEARALNTEMGWSVREDSGRGWRVVVASPKPVRIVDISAIELLARQGTVVVAGGGGGIPVICREDGTREGVEAVVDKDLTTSLMARSMGFDVMVILTAVSRVAVGFGTSQQRDLDHVTLSEIEALHEQGEFPPGSMGPKVEAAIDFLRNGGKQVVIAHMAEVMEALAGRTGTHIRANLN